MVVVLMARGQGGKVAAAPAYRYLYLAGVATAMCPATTRRGPATQHHLAAVYGRVREHGTTRQ
jgi:hypothetical protein